MTIALSAGAPVAVHRPAWPAIKRGAMGRCPHCGQGRMFSSYLRVNPHCAACNEALHHQRADDAPPYLTILVVGHVIGAMMLMVETYNDTLPLWIHALVWPTLALVASLWLLPIFKGGLIAYQWALRMHGFDTCPEDVL